MIKLSGLVAELRAERDRAHKTMKQIDAALAALGGLGRGASRSKRHHAQSRKPMSAAARRRIAAAQRARWAKRKASQKKPEARRFWHILAQHASLLHGPAT